MSNFSKLLIMQYEKKPKAIATINAYCGEADKQSENLLDFINQIDIDKATGFSLDIVGRRVGVSRKLPGAISKGYLGYFNSTIGEAWGAGTWYRQGQSTGDTLILGDSDYRFLIKAKIYKNFQNGTIDYISNALKQIIDPETGIRDNALIQDGSVMTATVIVPQFAINSLQAYLIHNMDILPRPMGVNYQFITMGDKQFGFRGFLGSYGFNEGSFIDA